MKWCSVIRSDRPKADPCPSRASRSAEGAKAPARRGQASRTRLTRQSPKGLPARPERRRGPLHRPQFFENIFQKRSPPIASGVPKARSERPAAKRRVGGAFLKNIFKKLHPARAKARADAVLPNHLGIKKPARRADAIPTKPTRHKKAGPKGRRCRSQPVRHKKAGPKGRRSSIKPSITQPERMRGLRGDFSRASCELNFCPNFPNVGRSPDVRKILGQKFSESASERKIAETPANPPEIAPKLSKIGATKFAPNFGANLREICPKISDAKN